MRSDLVDVSGQRFSRLVALRYVVGAQKWACLCDCGNEVLVTGTCLRRGSTKSCGCFSNESRRNRTIHGHARKRNQSPTYYIWHSMVNRATNPLCKAFPNYGGRGITVCDEWLDFSRFLADMGERQEGLTLERIDNNLGYSKENCRWATRAEQARNRRSNRMITHNGVTKLFSDWARDAGIRHTTLRARLDEYGWTFERALTTPVRRVNRA